MSNFLLKLTKNSNLLKNSLNVPNKLEVRFNGILSTKLTYKEYGDPIKVIEKQTELLPEPDNDEILIKMLATPINPADINTIEGKYPVRPTLPAVPGNEGVGEILKMGANCSSKDFKIGDRIVPLLNALGTWRTHLLINKQNVLKIPNKLGLIEAATLTVNPCTAYRMLRDFVSLMPGDTVIQNGANSACGQNVIQICRAWGVRTVNIVRKRENIDELKAFLKGLGATYTLTEDELRTTSIFKEESIEKPKLALNCIGGKNALEMLRHLQHSGCMVTYGGMSREPVTVPTSALIFKNLILRGFWMTEWSKRNAESVDRFEMFEELISMMTSNELQGPAFKLIDFDDYKDALMNTMTVKGMIGKKFVLSYDKVK